MYNIKLTKKIKSRIKLLEVKNMENYEKIKSLSKRYHPCTVGVKHFGQRIACKFTYRVIEQPQHYAHQQQGNQGDGDGFPYKHSEYCIAVGSATLVDSDSLCPLAQCGY